LKADLELSRCLHLYSTFAVFTWSLFFLASGQQLQCMLARVYFFCRGPSCIGSVACSGLLVAADNSGTLEWPSIGFFFFFFSRLDKRSTSRRSLHLYYSIALMSILPEVSFKWNFLIRCEQSQKVELPPNPLHKSTSAQFTLSRDLSQIDVRFGLAGTLMTSAILSCEGNIWRKNAVDWLFTLQWWLLWN